MYIYYNNGPLTQHSRREPELHVPVQDAVPGGADVELAAAALRHHAHAAVVPLDLTTTLFLRENTF